MVRALIAGSACLLVLSGCGESDVRSANEPTPTTAQTQDPDHSTPSAEPEPVNRRQGSGTIVTTGSSDYGAMLFDRSGQAIYLFDRERTSTPNCYRACAESWPPVLASGRQLRDRGRVDPALLGTTKRRDGSTQVTYGGHPLYFYAREGKHQVLCHNVEEYGGRWLVVRPNGQPAD